MPMFEGKDGGEYYQYALAVDSKQQSAQMELWSVAGKIAAKYDLTIPEIIAILGSVQHVYDNMLLECLMSKLPGATGQSVNLSQAEDINEDFLKEMKQDFEEGGFFSD